MRDVRFWQQCSWRVRSLESDAY